ncbi:MAG TPA: NAD-dependent epimerase/dehydratase family protein, partial [Aliidongia sp.]|uniref:NAD-dependent epimerase/dehydratase family protein n=1 Tax=Aliidongia sp. TaxID=1914230 RepID=UPI002DDDB85C
VGAGGTIGRAIVRALQEDHEIIAASRQEPVRVDIEDAASIERLFDEVPGIAAVVCCAASGALAPLGTASETDLETSIRGSWDRSGSR